MLLTLLPFFLSLALLVCMDRFTNFSGAAVGIGKIALFGITIIGFLFLFNLYRKRLNKKYRFLLLFLNILFYIIIYLYISFLRFHYVYWFGIFLSGLFFTFRKHLSFVPPARTIDFFHDFMVKKKESIKFFHEIIYLLSCFLFFLFSYFYFIEIDDYTCDDLVNPLQVVAQLSCFFFYFKYKKSDVRERHLILICFISSRVCTIYLKGIHFGLLCFLISFFSIFIYFFYVDCVPLVILLFYSLDVGLAKWGFYLLFQQLAYYVLSISLDKEQSIPPKRVIYTIILVLYIQFSVGLFFYKDGYFKEPAKLAVLLSGASILFICMQKRRHLAFLCSFFIYFFISLMIGLVSSLGKGTAFDLYGLSIFFLVHVIFLWGLELFILPHEKKALIPFLFYTLFYILPYFPPIEWISKWIEGFDLLLFFLSLFSFLEESRASHGRIEEGTNTNRTKKKKFRNFQKKKWRSE